MSLDYGLCDSALRRIDADVGASECHGILCGMLCGAKPEVIEFWWDELVGDGDPRNLAVVECRSIWSATQRETEQQLLSPDCDFSPLLPDDEVELPTRAAALGKWCAGFLYGLGLGEVSRTQTLSLDTQEILNDLSELARLDPSASDDDEEEESGYAELVEYVRICVLLIHAELRSTAWSLTPDVTH